MHSFFMGKIMQKNQGLNLSKKKTSLVKLPKINQRTAEEKNISKKSPSYAGSQVYREEGTSKKALNLDPNDQLRQLLYTVKAVRRGDFSVRLPTGEEGIIAEIGEVLNDIIELNENMTSEFARVRNTVGQ